MAAGTGQVSPRREYRRRHHDGSAGPRVSGRRMARRFRRAVSSRVILPAGTNSVTTQERILAFVNSQNGFAFYADILAHADVSPQRVDYALHGLQRQGLLRLVLGVYQLPDCRYIPPARSESGEQSWNPAFRRCRKCGTPKPPTSFYHAKDTRCKACRRALSAQARAERKARMAERLARFQAVVTADSENGTSSRRPGLERAADQLDF